MRVLRFLGGVLLIACMALGMADASVIRVDGRRPEAGADGKSWATAYPTLQAGLDAARENDEVWAAAGVYEECLVMPDQTALYGGFAGGETSREERDPQRNVTVIDAHRKAAGVRMTSGTVDGFTIQNADYDRSDPLNYGGGIDSEHGTAVITHNVFRNNIALGYGGGAYLTSGEVAFNVFENNVATDRGGGLGAASRAGAVNVHNNVFQGNRAPGGAAFCGRVGDAAFANNLVVGNESYFAAVMFESGGGVCANNTIVYNDAIVDGLSHRPSAIAFDGGAPETANNIVAFNNAGMGAWDGYGAPVETMASNCVFGNTLSDFDLMPDITGQNGNIREDPKFRDPGAGNFRLTAGSPCIDGGTDAVIEPAWTALDGLPRRMGAHADIGAYETPGPLPPPPTASRVYLSPSGADKNDGLSWGTAKRTLRAAALILAPKGEVWLAAGDYEAYVKPLPPGTSVLGGFAGTETDRAARRADVNVTTIHTGPSGSLIVAPGDGRDTLLDGFTMYGGGPGIVCESASPTISHIRFAGLPIAVQSRGGSPLIQDNAFVGGSSSVECQGGSPEIRANQFGSPTSLTASGPSVTCNACSGAVIEGNVMAMPRGSEAGLVCDASTASINGNTFANCALPYYAAQNYMSATVRIRGAGANVAFERNSITGAIADALVVLDGASARVSDCVFTLNTGAAVLCSGGSVTLDNNAIVRNGGASGAVDVAGAASATVRNNIVAFNSAGLALPASAAVSSNCVYGNLSWGFSGTADPTGRNGNIAVDPRFAGLDYGDLRLQADSPCRDAGDDAAVRTGDTDADGKPRMVGRHVDMGAYEFAGAAHAWPAAVVRVSPSGADSADGSSWARAKRTIQGAMDALPAMGGEIWVAAGAYNGTVDAHPGARAYGGFAGWETRRDQRNAARNLSRVTGGQVTIQVYAPGCVWDGFRMEGSSLYCHAGALIAHNAFLPGTSVYGSRLYLTACSALARDNLFSAAGHNPAVVITSGAPGLVGNTFVGNDTAVRVSGAKAIIANNLMAYGGAAVESSGGAPILRNNCVFGNASDYTGLPDPTGRDGNIRRDPKLVNPAIGDARIQPSSPCVNAGDNSAVTPDDTDLLGKPRVIRGRVDIGAYESDGRTIPTPETRVVRVATNGNDAWDGSSWTRPKRTIGAAIAFAAQGGGEVWVGAGLYAEPIAIPPYVSVYGGYARVPTTRAGRNPATNVTTISTQNSDYAVLLAGGWRTSRLDGFTVRARMSADPTPSRRSVWIASGSPSVVGCDTGRIETGYGSASPVVAGCRVSGGIRLAGGSPTIASCVVRGGITMENCVGAAVGNTVITGASTAGISGGTSGLWCVNNTIVGNAAGLDSFSSNRSYYANNIIAFNGSGVRLNDAKPANFRNNCVFGNAEDFPGGKDPTGWAGNIHKDPRLADWTHAAVALMPSSPCRDAGDDASAPAGQTDAAGGPRRIGAAVDMGALETNGAAPAAAVVPVFRVSPSGNDANSGATWNWALRTIGAGLAAARAAGGGEVWVARGVYKERLTLGAFEGVYGGFAGNEASLDQRPASGAETILDGGGAYGPLVTAMEGYRVSTVDGFTIRNARSLSASGGFAIAAVRGNAPVLSRNRITANLAGVNAFDLPAPGDVLYLSGPAAIIDCDIVDNQGVGILCYSLLPALIARNLVSGNGGLDYGGGMAILGSADVKDNVIAANEAYIGGGGVVLEPLVGARAGIRLVNNTIVGNRAETGGGIYLYARYGGPPAIANNIVAFNSSGIALDAAYSGPTPWLRNNDVFGNDGLAFMNITDQTGINGNISADPLFLAPKEGNWYPGAGSPCTDAGADDVVAAGDLDYGGGPRIAGPRVDIGACEGS